MNAAGFAAVAVGAVLGAWLRWAMAVALNASGSWLPLGTLLANLSGGLLVGLSMGWFESRPSIDPVWRLALVTGFLGALTTFSTFSAESLQMIQRGELGVALLHSTLHLVGSLVAAAAGYWLVSVCVRTL
jgi:fluoride exporter